MLWTQGFHCTKDNIFIADINNNLNKCFYSGMDIHDLFNYLDIIGAFINLTYSRHHLNYSVTKTNTYLGYMYPVIADLRGGQRIICQFFGYTGHKYGSCIIRGTISSPKINLFKKNQYNTVHVHNPN